MVGAGSGVGAEAGKWGTTVIMSTLKTKKKKNKSLECGQHLQSLDACPVRSLPATLPIACSLAVLGAPHWVYPSSLVHLGVSLFAGILGVPNILLVLAAQWPTAQGWPES